MAETNSTRYAQIIERIFFAHFHQGAEEVPFDRSEIVGAASDLNVRLPKNLGDVVYSFKYRTPLPESVVASAPSGKEWVIVNRGKAKYAFVARRTARIQPDSMLVVTKIPDATPGIVSMYALSDEQALLAKLRYNRLLEIFSGVACYSLQSHLRTTVPGMGQVETDELYVGVDKRGAHYVFPVQAKGGSDELGVVQIEQDIALCRDKFPSLICRSIAAQFMPGGVIAMFELEIENDEVRKVAERHYQLVPPDELSEEELLRYRTRSEAE
ncbi:MAG TPA: hypothetical protein VFG50_05525 [Rhodothermales bacterium]|nr:hypothetical protein [Rhodothermales bacterium]